MTKAQERMLDNYNRSNVRTLNQVCARYSANKERAYRECEYRRSLVNGYDVRIPSHSKAAFTYAFRFIKDNKVWLHYETAYNVYEFVIREGV